jgi:hypothetical protein
MDDGSRPVGSAEDRMWVQLHVRAIASEISDYARRNAHSVLGDATMARPLMASAVAVVSRYLMIYRIPLSRGMTKTLLRACFRRALQRDAARLDQREFCGGTNDLEEAMLSFVNSGRSIGYMDSGHIVRLLSQRSLRILGLRDLGYTWKEIGHFLSMSEFAAKRMFRAELQQAMEIADHSQFRQAELEIAKRRKLDRSQGTGVVPFATPIWD